MTQAHIDWRSDEMKVKLAVETLSSSVSNAMEYLMGQGFTEFEGAGPTIRFVRCIDDTFNVCNSTNMSILKQNALKRPWIAENIGQIGEFCNVATEYIKGLQIRNDSGRLVSLCTSANKGGFQGFVICLRSLTTIYNDLVIGKNLMSNFTTHAISQDHLEQIFGIIRSFNGSNNNPTCQQFNEAMRKILASTTLHAPKKGNCTVLQGTVPIHNPYSNILSITSRKPKAISCESIENDITSLRRILSQF